LTPPINMKGTVTACIAGEKAARDAADVEKPPVDRAEKECIIALKKFIPRAT
jgi:hypothetical protein